MRGPLEWAGTQLYLGNALQALGTRESGTTRLEQETSDRYIAQVRVYSQAVGAAMNAPTRGLLLVV